MSKEEMEESSPAIIKKMEILIKGQSSCSTLLLLKAYRNQCEYNMECDSLLVKLLFSI